jgi:arylsulfatase
VLTTRLALDWLNRHKSENFFLYIHFFEPHSPYDPPPADDLFRSDAYPYLHDTGHDIEHAPAQRLAMLGDQKAIERLYQLYDGKIHYIDRYVGQILDFLRSSGLEYHSLVVLTSDHGELLFSHPEDLPDGRSLVAL